MSGLIAVFKKELADNLASWRFIILFALVLLAGLFATHSATSAVRAAVTGDSKYVFLVIFTLPGENLPSFLSLIGLVIPIVGIALGFDAINRERNGGTLSRLLSQPIYRDTVINAKFLAGTVTIGLMMSAIILLVSGIGMRLLGLPPTSEEAARILVFLLLSVLYGAFWLALSILFSILFRHVATSALASLALWIFFTFFLSWMATPVANLLSPPGETIESQLTNANTALAIMRISPITLFQESMMVVLVPGSRTISQMLQIYAGGGEFLMPTSLSFGQSLINVWPLMVALVVLTAVCFAVSYIRFMREEIRAT